MNNRSATAKAVPMIDCAPQTITALSLDVAGACNLRCSYCAEGMSLNRRKPMTDEVMSACLRFVASYGTTRGVSLQFGGGEPLLNRSLLRRIGERVAGMGDRRPALHLTTNGTLIDDETIHWLYEQGWHVKVSLDGPAPVHNQHRVWPDGRGTFDQVQDAVLRLVDRMPDRISVAAVLYRGVDPAETFELVRGYKVRSVDFVPVIHYDPEFRLSADDVSRYSEFMTDYVKRYLVGEQMPKLVRFMNKVMRTMGYDTSMVSCGAGRFLLGVDGLGTIYPCLGMLGMDKYRLGTIYRGPDEELLKEFVRRAGRPYDERPHCRQCNVAALCGGPCFASAELIGLSEHAPPPETCSYNQVDVRAGVWLVNELSHIDPTMLLSFLPGSNYDVW